MNKVQVIDLNLELETSHILSDINFDIPFGKITGLIGNNGAGKTSLIKCVTGFYKNYDGNIKINNQDLTTKQMSYIMDSPVYYDDLTFGEHIEFISTINKSQELTHYYISLFEVGKYLNHFPGELSKGTLQKMMIILALLRRKELLIADEPFSGLDPSQVNLFKEELIRVRDEGSAILISSHQLSLIEEICDKFIFIKNGKIAHIFDNLSKDNSINDLYKKYFGK